ncbi:MAG: protein kinase domain-containing protein [Pseudomarimonas sp.]
MKTHLGHYEIVEELGRGGMGVVYKGYEPALGRFVAIKELSPALAHDANLVERFLREARSMAVLNDPHIIQVYFIGTDEATGQPFFAMEFVEGDSLSGLLKREGKLSVENALKIMHQTALGLATAHDKGVIHRDIKPGNLMLTPRGNVKIADFGIALATQDFSKKLTSTGEFVGTPGYLSPEICIGKTVDQRSDIFSLGVVLFEMLTGRVPFMEESPLGLMLEVVKAEFPDIRQLNGEVDMQAAEILANMVAKDPADRYQDCHALAEALQTHPLVARGGTIKFNLPKAPVSNATVIGVPTPASQKQRVATAPPVVARSSTGAAQPVQPTPTAASAAAMPPPQAVPPQAPQPPRSSALERSRQPGNGSKVALAIAAALVLLVGGVAFAMKSTLMDYARGVKDGLTGNTSAYAEGVATGKATNPIGTSQAATNPSAAQATGLDSTAATLSATTAVTPEPAALEVDPMSNSTAAVEGTTSGTAESVALSVEQAEVATQAAVDVTQASAAQVVANERPIASAVMQKVAERRQNLATAEPVRPAVIAPPRIAVIALGDLALVGPARQRVEERLLDAGFDVVDTELIAGVSGRSDLPGIFQALRREASVVVVIRADGVGSEQLQYYGQSSTLYTANLSVRSYVIADKRPLGAGFRESVKFTSLNADSKAEEAVRPHLSGMVNELSPYRRRGAG